ncbi:MAG: effector protein [Pigeon pea little leaf phytoplasma]|uniref:Effector protein n=2 Tax=Candidatus Phytoplasma fabacearum TaxID=2982628 RepID=A0ABU8ZT48_9MOLU|nr:effector protein ['Bituminaria bituminosa' little leaf phytoplasma]MDV3149094.1 effector protein [Pigeon pea little leaf phytoplasma]MDO8024139.1 effector protein ['Bituminaria bituminosa' little leaf phytoplasma]MDO8030846.1 effector protein ['Bituminaria bituminosa' little leaf phytoplasma]MDV3154309.1 effector protein [Pigeon pea little leaf phytoplasma]MDV3158861.1 effector protein [Pigeon pea little leaf phytoplasma]
MNLNIKKIQIKKQFNIINLFIIIVTLIFINNRKTYLVYAGSKYSVVKKTNSSEILFDSTETKIEILRAKIDQVLMKRNEVLKEIDSIEKELLSLNLIIKNKNNFHYSRRGAKDA